MAGNPNQQPNENDSSSSQMSPTEPTNNLICRNPDFIDENFREAGLSLGSESEVSDFFDDQENNEANMFHQVDNDSGGEVLGSELELGFSDDDFETDFWSSTGEYDNWISDVSVYYMGGFDGDEAFDEGWNVGVEDSELGVDAGNVTRGVGDEISPDGGDVEINGGMGDISETGSRATNIEAWGGEEDGWGSMERNNGHADNLLVFDFGRHGVIDLRPQVVLTVGENGSVGGERNISPLIPELVECVSALTLTEREIWEWEERSIHGSHVNHRWTEDEVDDAYYIGEHDMIFEEYLLDTGAYETPAAISAVEDLTSSIITQETIENDHVTCAVCLDEFKVGEITKVLPCSHFFHEDCILSWLEIHNTCPVCRRRLPTDDPE